MARPLSRQAVGAVGGITNPLHGPLCISRSIPFLLARADPSVRRRCLSLPPSLSTSAISGALPPSVTPSPDLSLSDPLWPCRPLLPTSGCAPRASDGPLHRACWVWVNPQGSPLRRTGNPLLISCCNVDFNLDFMVVRVCIVRLV